MNPSTSQTDMHPSQIREESGNSFSYFSSRQPTRRDFLKGLIAWGTAVALDKTTGTSSGRMKPPTDDHGETFAWVRLDHGALCASRPMKSLHGQPGSLMKLVATAAMREENLLPVSQRFECRGTLQQHGQTYHCQHPHGILTLPEALGVSCNLFFVQASEVLSPGMFLQYAKAFGFHQPVCGINAGSFPAQATGQSAVWVLGLAPSLTPGIGQILRMTAAIATRGTAPPLHMDGINCDTDQVFRIRLAPSTWDVLQTGMRLSAETGTARNLDPDQRLHLSAKTGTTPLGRKYQSWVTGFFPREAPRYAFCLRSPEGTSQDTAVPLAHRHLMSRTWS